MTKEVRIQANRLAHKIEALEGDLSTLRDYANTFNCIKLMQVTDSGCAYHTVVIKSSDGEEEAKFIKAVRVLLEIAETSKVNALSKELEAL